MKGEPIFSTNRDRQDRHNGEKATLSLQTKLGRHTKVFILEDSFTNHNTRNYLCHGINMTANQRISLTVRGNQKLINDGHRRLSRRFCFRLRAVSLFQSVQRNSRDTKKTARDTEGARRARSSSARALLSRNQKNKRDCSQSNFVCEKRAVVHRLRELQAIFWNGNSYLAVAGHMHSPKDYFFE